MITLMATRSTAPDDVFRNAETSPDLRAEAPVNSDIFSALRRCALLEGCKWDPQVGDESTLSAFPLVLKSSAWKRMARQAEQLAEETIAAEEEISRRPELMSRLGLPRALRRVLEEKTPPTASRARVMRFDFHPTTEGWRISEVNSDVPGGYTESSHFTEMIAREFPRLGPAGNPGDVWSDALASAARPSGLIALLSAPGYLEDHQVVAFLAARLRERGCRPYLAKPQQIVWRDGLASLETSCYRGPLDAIVRFFQAEWLAKLPGTCGWKYFFRGARTSVANPALAVISESKRFPLLWDKVSVALPTWRALLPETRDPRDAPWSCDEGWILKTAMCNTGDTVSVREWMPTREWTRTRMAVHLAPGNWVAQRRFESVPVSTTIGRRHVCLGVYTVNGRAAGAYARFSRKPLIDFAATDAALLLEVDE
jgi:hypothetical protein